MTRPVTGSEKKSFRLNMLFEPAELEQLDDFRYAARIPSRSAAIRYLMKLGMEKHQEVAGENKNSEIQKPAAAISDEIAENREIQEKSHNSKKRAQAKS